MLTKILNIFKIANWIEHFINMMKFENKTESEPFTRIKCSNQFINDLYKYTDRVIYFLGIVFNILNIIVFIKIIKKTHQNRTNTNQMFKYLLVKSINVAIYFIICVFDLAFYCTDCEVKRTYLIQLWFKWLYWYIAPSLLSNSSMLEAISSFECFLGLKNKWRFLSTNAAFCTITIAITLFNLTLYSYSLFEVSITRNITINSQNETIKFYISVSREFAYSDEFELAISFTRDILPMIILILFDSLILGIIRQTTKRRRNLTIPRSSNSNQNQLIASAQRAQTNIIKTILAMGINYTILHIPLVIYYLPFNLINKTSRDCLRPFAWMAYEFSLTNTFFIYFLFNQTFKKYIFSIIKFK
jgi:hypothetical protein